MFQGLVSQRGKVVKQGGCQFFWLLVDADSGDLSCWRIYLDDQFNCLVFCSELGCLIVCSQDVIVDWL